MSWCAFKVVDIILKCLLFNFYLRSSEKIII